jgi:ABC-type transport system involved in cytochrome bd biosynthesis fused ATPase/permease subunit
VIAHRLSTVRSADLVAVLEQGRITELGTPAELLARDSAWAPGRAMSFDAATAAGAAEVAS